MSSLPVSPNSSSGGSIDGVAAQRLNLSVFSVSLDDTDYSMQPAEVSGLDDIQEPVTIVHTTIDHVTKSSQRIKHQLSVEDCKNCVMLTTVIESTKEHEIPIGDSVTLYAMKNIIEYLKHHNGKEITDPEKPIRSKIMREICKDEWDATFADRIHAESFECDKIYECILGANYLHIESLINLLCAKVAAIVKNENIDNIDRLIGVAKSVKSENDESKEMPRQSANTSSVLPCIP